MLQDGHAAHVQLPSLGHGGTGSYIGQQGGSVGNEAAVPPPEQPAAEGIGFANTAASCCSRVMCQTKTGMTRGNFIHRVDFCGMGH